MWIPPSFFLWHPTIISALILCFGLAMIYPNILASTGTIFPRSVFPDLSNSHHLLPTMLVWNLHFQAKTATSSWLRPQQYNNICMTLSSPFFSHMWYFFYINFIFFPPSHLYFSILSVCLITGTILIIAGSALFLLLLFFSQALLCVFHANSVCREKVPTKFHTPFKLLL